MGQFQSIINKHEYFGHYIKAILIYEDYKFIR